MDRLYELEMEETAEGNLQPALLTLSDEAKRLWIEFYDEHAKQQVELTGDLAAAWSKLEEHPARLALVVHFARWAAEDPSLESSEILDAESMRIGITLAEWFKRETKRVYALLNSSEEEHQLRDLAEWIDRRGGEVTVREVQQGHRKLENSEQAEAALQSLVDAGWGSWEQRDPGGSGGRPTRVFCLSSVSTSTKPPETAEIGGCVDVDDPDSAISDEDYSDWLSEMLA